MFGKPLCITLLGALFGVAIAASAEAKKQDGIYPNGMCWNAKVVEVHFNPVLSVELENPFNRERPFPSIGSSAERERSMELAVDSWNDALKAIGAVTRLKLVETRAFGGRQGSISCYDSDFRGEAVFNVDYTRHGSDGYSIGSSSEPNRSGARGYGAGWVIGNNTTAGDIDQRLAETGISPRPTDNALNIRESDILWFTHVSETSSRCTAIRWNYATGKLVEAAPYYDFHSAMLHQLGHFLGLAHREAKCDLCSAGGSAMRPTIKPGERLSVTACEREALKALYAPGMRCGSPTK